MPEDITPGIYTSPEQYNMRPEWTLRLIAEDSFEGDEKRTRMLEGLAAENPIFIRDWQDPDRRREIIDHVTPLFEDTHLASQALLNVRLVTLRREQAKQGFFEKRVTGIKKLGVHIGKAALQLQHSLK